MSLHPLIDFSQLSTQELQEKQKEYTKKLYNISSTSPLYDAVLSMKLAVDAEYNERVYLERYKENKNKIEEVVDIGTMTSDVTHPDYSDYKDQVIKSLAEFYTNKDSNDDQNN